jgi:hypothetical protein
LKALKVKRRDKAIATMRRNSEFAAQYPRIRGSNALFCALFLQKCDCRFAASYALKSKQKIPLRNRLGGI